MIYLFKIDRLEKQILMTLMFSGDADNLVDKPLTVDIDNLESEIARK